MKNKIRNNYILTVIFLILFGLFTVLVKTVDVKPVGPQGSLIGFSTVNTALFNFFGQNSIWYTVSEGVGYLALLVAFAFAMIGFIQFLKRKSVFKIDADIIALGGLYLLTVITYILFEIVIVNYRPVLVSGMLEASYPSSHTMLVITILGSAGIQIDKRIQNKPLKIFLKAVCIIAIVATVIGRVASGMHWITDVIGAVLLSAFLVMTYYSVVKHIEYIKK